MNFLLVLAGIVVVSWFLAQLLKRPNSPSVLDRSFFCFEKVMELRPGDTILKYNDFEVEGRTDEEKLNHLRSFSNGQMLRIVVRRASGAEYTYVFRCQRPGPAPFFWVDKCAGNTYPNPSPTPAYWLPPGIPPPALPM